MEELSAPISRRHATVVLAAVLAGCKQDAGRNFPARACPASELPSAGISIDIVCDRTTELSPLVSAKLVAAVDQVAGPGDVLRLVRFGGRQQDLLEVACETGISESGDRWRDPPNELRRRQACEQEARGLLGKALSAALADLDHAPDGISPIFEVVATLAESWQQGTPRSRLCILCSDGVTHSQAMSWIGRASSLVLPKPEDFKARLRTLGLLPQHLQAPVHVVHIGFASNEDLNRRRPRAAGEVALLRRLWEAYWAALGVRSVVFGNPIPLQPPKLWRAA